MVMKTFATDVNYCYKCTGYSEAFRKMQQGHSTVLISLYVCCQVQNLISGRDGWAR